MAVHPLMPELVEFLKQGPASTKQIEEYFGGWRATLRLKLLRLVRAGIIRRVKVGTADGATAIYYVPEGGASKRWAFSEEEIKQAWFELAPTLIQWSGVTSKTTLVFIFTSVGKFLAVYPQSLEYVRSKKAKFFVNTLSVAPNDLASSKTWKWVSEHPEECVGKILAMAKEKWSNVEIVGGGQGQHGEEER